MTQFECDVCVFRKLYHRETNPHSEPDRLAEACIRRVLLDAFWSRASSTVTQNASKLREGLSLSRRLGLMGPYAEPGPLPPTDHCGYEVAMQIVLSSLDPGRHSPDYKQWDTIRRLRTVFSNQSRASRVANAYVSSLSDMDGKNYTRITKEVCGSLWFARFARGCNRRMGQDWRPDQAISVDLEIALLEYVEIKLQTLEDPTELALWSLAGAYFAFSFVLSLRGNEGLLVDLKAMIEHDTQHQNYVVVPLLGKVKGEHHVRQHLLPSVHVTDSGVQMGLWHRRVLETHLILGRSSGPAFINRLGVQSSSSDMNELFHEALLDLFEEHRDLFPPNIRDPDEVTDRYDVGRSFRRGSESRAASRKVDPSDNYIVNRWKKKERAGHSRPSQPINQHYTDISLCLDSFLRYTQAM